MFKLSLIVALFAFTTSTFASVMQCDIVDAGELIRSYTVALDADGAADIETEKYDLFWFGASATGGDIYMVWAGNEDEKKSSEPVDIIVTSSRGTEIRFVCDII